MSSLDYFLKDKNGSYSTGVKRIPVLLSGKYPLFKYEIFLQDVCVVAYILPGDNDDDDVWHMFLCLSGESRGKNIDEFVNRVRSGKIVLSGGKMKKSLDNGTLAKIALDSCPEFWAMKKDVSIDINSDFSDHSEQNLKIIKEIIGLFEYTMDMFKELSHGRVIGY